LQTFEDLGCLGKHHLARNAGVLEAVDLDEEEAEAEAQEEEEDVCRGMSDPCFLCFWLVRCGDISCECVKRKYEKVDDGDLLCRLIHFNSLIHSKHYHRSCINGRGKLENYVSNNTWYLDGFQ